MKRPSLITIILFLGTCTTAQTTRYFQDDPIKHFYSKTEFEKIDSLELWKFQFNKSPDSLEQDTVHPVANITFWRNTTIDDGISMEVYGRQWTPHISFKVFHLNDSLYCKKISSRVRHSSSCVAPNVGGDYVVLGNYILLNTNTCVECGRYDTGTDYCRPILNRVLEAVENNKVQTIQDMEKELSKTLSKEVSVNLKK